MLVIDGSAGEGGGQVLRTALGLALVTGRSFLIEGIRARRSRPGLQRQHLTAVLAAARIGDARVEGAALGSLRLTFAPRRVQAGDYRFGIGTAGSTTLVLQSLLPALFAAAGPSTVELVGGTHNPMAPPFEFLQHAFAPALLAMGAGLRLSLRRHGFHPVGCGILRAEVTPAAWRPIELLERAERPRLRARILLAGIPRHVGDREAAVLRSGLGLRADEVIVEEVESASPGNAVLLHLAMGRLTEVVSALGERGIPAEQVAGNVVAEAGELLAANVPVGAHLADQLLIPMALAGGGAFATLEPTLHARTNAEVIAAFLPVEFGWRPDAARAGAWIVSVRRP